MDRHECDVLVAGSGAGGFSAAITAAHEGLDVLIVEKEPVFGGTNTGRIPVFVQADARVVQADARVSKSFHIKDTELQVYLDVYNVFVNLLALLGIFGGSKE